MNRKVIITEDGSSSLLMQDWGETYHSVHGAVQETQHVYIENGLRFLFSQNKKEQYAVLEMGFGTGLTALLTAQNAADALKKVNYTGIEAFPLTEGEWKTLNYTDHLPTQETLLYKVHEAVWETAIPLTPFFTLTKTQQRFETLCVEGTFDLIYFDVFGYKYQPELWTEAIFEQMKDLLYPGGILVTYACKAAVNKILKNLGFEVHKLKGPPGKREMTRAILVKK